MLYSVYTGTGLFSLFGSQLADDTQTTVRRRQSLAGYKGRDFVCAEVDAIDEDIRCIDFGKWPAGGSLGHIPLDDLGIRDAGLLAEINSPRTTAAARADNDDPRDILVLGLRLGR